MGRGGSGTVRYSGNYEIVLLLRGFLPHLYFIRHDELLGYRNLPTIPLSLIYDNRSLWMCSCYHTSQYRGSLETWIRNEAFSQDMAWHFLHRTNCANFAEIKRKLKLKIVNCSRPYFHSTFFHICRDGQRSMVSTWLIWESRSRSTRDKFSLKLGLLQCKEGHRRCIYTQSVHGYPEFGPGDNPFLFGMKSLIFAVSTNGDIHRYKY